MFGVFINFFNSKKWKLRNGLKPSDVVLSIIDDKREAWEMVKWWLEFASEENYRLQIKVEELNEKIRQLKK